MTPIDYQVPVTRSSYLSAFVSVFSEAGLDKSKLLNESRLPIDIKSDDDEFVPTLSMRRLIYSAANELGEKRTLNLIRSVFRDKAVPSVLHLFAQYSTVREALEDTASIFSIDSPGSAVYLQTEQGKTWFCRSSYNEPFASIQWHEPFVIAYVMELVSGLSNINWAPTELKLQVTDTTLVNHLVGHRCQLYIGQVNTAIFIPDDILDKKISIRERSISNTETFVKWHTTFSDTVYDLIESYSREQSLTVAEAADILGLTERTLQRKLKAEHTSYQNIKDSVLYSLSCQMMKKGQNLTYIASQLGFQNMSHFSRSFRRITGVTPREYLKVLSDPNI
ncbi:helix-turn-helix domain-containing protein [Vibrio astriarenae]|uniref:helix-turn-helix domain-containing protein n=1 Tax=Vibrio astriarenae TaxID=1481923 RepID=UPI0037365190